MNSKEIENNILTNVALSSDKLWREIENICNFKVSIQCQFNTAGCVENVVHRKLRNIKVLIR